MLKFAGILMIFIAGTGMGTAKSMELTKRERKSEKIPVADLMFKRGQCAAAIAVFLRRFWKFQKSLTVCTRSSFRVLRTG